MNNEVMNNKKGINIAIVLLISLIMLALGVLIGKLIFKTDEQIKEDTEVKENKLEVITETSLAKELEEKLIVDNIQGLYYKNKISADEKNNVELIKFGINNYVKENNIKYNYQNGENFKYNGTSVGKILLNVSKNDIKEYMQKLFGNNVDYNIEDIKFEGFESLNLQNMYNGPILVTDSNNYQVVSLDGGSGLNTYTKNKLIKAEKENDYVYIYDKAVQCTSEIGFYCNNVQDDNETENATLDCSLDEDGKYVNSYCDSIAKDEEVSKAAAEYALESLSSKLNTYKHTFKKNSDGKYYWVSSEISSK